MNETQIGVIQNQKRNVYINQFNSASARNLIPLACGLLTAHAKSIPKIVEHYNLELEILRDKPESIVARYKDPYILAYSCYFWNLNQSLEVAKLAKETYPNAMIVFGGPSVPIREQEIAEFYKKHPFIDIIVGGEGEQVFSDILLALIDNDDVSSIDGISYKDKDGRIIIKKMRPYIKDVSVLPSPYLDGTFDQLLERYGRLLTGVVLETNRGCPFTCSFCFWGGPDSKISQFSLDRAFKELEWISRNKISYIFGADANFGILKRDLEIARHLGNLCKTTGYPNIFVINWTKNATDKIFDIVDVLNENGVTFMLTTSVQSHNPATLDAIKRQNIRLESFQKILDEAAKRDFHTYSELILGLPLETYETFKKGIAKTMTPNVNYHFNIYNCILIPGTEMGQPGYIEQYNIETRKCELHFGKTVDRDAYVKEYQDIVVSTSTMSVDGWRKAYTFGYFAKALYGFRPAFFILLYLKKEYNVDYEDLLEFIISTSTNNDLYKNISKSLEVLREMQDSILNNGRETIRLDWAKANLHPEVACFITLLRNKKEFYNELYSLLSKYFRQKDIKINEKAFKEVFVYQYCRIPAWNSNNLHKIRFNYNFGEYFDYDYYKSYRRLENSLPYNLLIHEQNQYADVGEFMAKQIYGGLIFSLSKVEMNRDVMNSHEFVEAQEYFNNLFKQQEILIKKID